MFKWAEANGTVCLQVASEQTQIGPCGVAGFEAREETHGTMYVQASSEQKHIGQRGVAVKQLEEASRALAKTTSYFV
jgi:hypothetical protein